MIDTDKYEGHTRGPWTAFDVAEPDLMCEAWAGATEGWFVINDLRDLWPIERKDFILLWDENGESKMLPEADAQLIADAPLLLEEVKWLSDRLKQAHHFLRDIRDGLIADRDWVYINEYLGDEEE